MATQASTVSLSSLVTTITPILMMQQSSTPTTLKDTIMRVLSVLAVQLLMNLGEWIKAARNLFNRPIKDNRKVISLTCSNTFKDGVYTGSENSEEAKAVIHALYVAAIDGRLADHKFKIQQANIGLRKSYVVCLDNVDVEVEFTTKEGGKVLVSCTQSETTSQGTTQSGLSAVSCNATIKTYWVGVRPVKSEDGLSPAQDFVNECMDKYNNDIVNKSVPHSIFVLAKFIQGTVSSYNDISFVTTKSFDNLYFEGKNDLVRRILDFEQNEARYKRLGIPYTMGMMFHGVPGCGKTSCIKAIAQLTGRHIVSVPVKLVNKVEELKELFMNKHIMGYNIPMHKRLYVFEEIDCGQWKSIVRSRKREVDGADSNLKALRPDTSDMVECMKMVMGARKDVEADPCATFGCNITLGDLLELLDGIVEMSGRMIIMTSNHPERIDEALLRPGRIDLMQEFKRMTRADIASMYRLWFGKDMPGKVYERVRDHVFSQADIGNLFSRGGLDVVHSGLMRM